MRRGHQHFRSCRARAALAFHNLVCVFELFVAFGERFNLIVSRLDVLLVLGALGVETLLQFCFRRLHLPAVLAKASLSFPASALASFACFSKLAICAA